MKRRRAVRRTSVAVLGILLLSTGLAACGPERVAGTRCYQDIWAHDATHLLRCIDGRWTRVITRAEANAFWKAVAEKQEASKPKPPPPPSVPTPLPKVPGPGWAAKTISAGLFHSCAVDLDGGTSGPVHCWGSGTGGQLGDGRLSSSLRATPVSDITNARSIDSSEYGTCAVLSDDTVRCWGTNVSGQLSTDPAHYESPLFTGSLNGKILPRPVVVQGLTNVAQVSLGTSYSCALKWDRTVWCWGSQISGRLGNGSIAGNDVLTPTRVGGVSNAVSISAGAAHACALRGDGWTLCWGSNAAGQLGNGTGGPNVGFPQNQSGTAVLVNRYGQAFASARAVEASGAGTCLLDPNGRTWCWGDNSYGQLGFGGGNPIWPGYGNTISEAVPKLLDGNRLGVGSANHCTRYRNGTVKCWGNNQAGQLGTPGGYFSITPQTVTGLSAALDIVASPNHACARRTDGTVACWGYNLRGQLGDGTITSRPDARLVRTAGGAVGVF